MTITEQLELIAKGVDPTTGEMFSTNIFQNDLRCNNAIRLLSISAFPKLKFGKPHSVNLLNRPVNKIFGELKAWRAEMAKTLGLPAYCIFSDQDLINIASSDACCKEDLLQCRGISLTTYDLYADDLFDIIKPYIE